MLVEKIVKLPVYTINLRLYPTSSQKEIIDTIIHELHKACNIAVYDMFTNLTNTTEREDKESKQKIHFPNINTMIKKDYLEKLREERPSISIIPASALSGNNGVFKRDLSKRLDAQVSEGNQKKKTNGKGVKRPIENSKAPYYSQKHPRRSYTYQETLSKIIFNEINDNVVHLNLNKVGRIKARGMKNYLRILRFDETCNMTFKEYCELHKRTAHLFTIKKDNCGDYFIQICLKNVYKLIKDSDNKKEIGIDVGVTDLMILSDGTKYSNPRFKNGEHGEVQKHREQLHRQLSRREGFANIKFREKYKVDHDTLPSKRYQETKLQAAKLERKVARQRKYHMENMVLDVIRQSSFIGIENLSVKDMMKNVKKNKSET